MKFSNSSYKSYGTVVRSGMGNALNGSTLFMGTCNGLDYSEDEILAEILYSEFNLECGKW